MNSLRKEFKLFRKATKQAPRCAEAFWGNCTPTRSTGASIIPFLNDVESQDGDHGDEDDEDALITFDDWLQVDNWYRSRALEFPGIGDAMVPCIDMANHASGEATGALYQCDSDGNAMLLLRDRKNFKPDNEVTITYGDKKGACEMIFSYGFLEDDTEDARETFLSFDIPDDDPLARAKKHIAKSAPGFKIFHSEDEEKIEWHGPFVYLSIVNEEDGWDFKVLQTTDGARELKAFFKDQEITGEEQLIGMLEKDEMWDVFRLRAVCLLESRVSEQLAILHVSNKGTEMDHHGVTTATEEKEVQLIGTLRQAEGKLLEEATQEFEKRVRCRTYVFRSC